MTGWTITPDTYSAGYDDLNRLVSLTGGGLNRAIANTASGERILVRDGTTSTMVTLRDLSGNVLRELTCANGAWRWQKDYVYRDGLLLASVGGATDSTTGRWEGIHHYHLDQLGSPRLVTNRSGEMLKAFVTNPFGKDPDTGNQDVERMRFTIHERDIGSRTSTLDDMDYMITRAYAPFLGRFTSADLLRGDPRSPQTFNLFAYVAGNPVTRIDPSGMEIEGTLIFYRPIDGGTQPPQSTLIAPWYSAPPPAVTVGGGGGGGGRWGGGGGLAGAMGIGCGNGLPSCQTGGGYFGKGWGDWITRNFTVPGPWGSEQAANTGGWNDIGSGLTGGWDWAFKASYGTAGAAAALAGGLIAAEAAGMPAINVFAHGGPNWHVGLETVRHESLIHIGRDTSYGIHLALGYLRPFVAKYHVYVYPYLYTYTTRLGYTWVFKGVPPWMY